MEIENRIKAIIKLKTGENRAKFASEIDVDPARINAFYRKDEARKPQSMPTSDLVIAILAKYPDIDGDWLLMGRGAMLVADRQRESASRFAAKIVAHGDQALGSLQEQLAWLWEGASQDARYRFNALLSDLITRLKAGKDVHIVGVGTGPPPEIPAKKALGDNG